MRGERRKRDKKRAITPNEVMTQSVRDLEGYAIRTLCYLYFPEAIGETLLPSERVRLLICRASA